MLQAASGFMSLTGYADRPPLRSSIPMLDVATALTACSAILAALRARDQYGTGQQIEVALLDVAMSTLTLFGMAALVSGHDLQRSGNRAPQTAPSDVYETTDGLIFITCGNNRLFTRLVTDALGRPELAADPEFASNAERVAHIDRLSRLLAESFATQPRAYWVERLSSVGVPVAPILTMTEALASPDVLRRGIVQEIPHPKAGTVPTIRSPILMDKTPAVEPVAPPLLGQHTSAILADVLAWTPGDISQAAAAGAFGPPP
jgi:crotonobetainyl-CoA:carnitine CoA-transferase CaiB-like acyl-CoA transferase